MDSVIIDANSPQEEEFALVALGVPSVYRALFDPRRLPELARWLNPEEWRIDQPANWTETWREFVSGVNADSQCRLVLKSPAHTFRMHVFSEMCAEAVFVWIVRDPLDVFLSNRKMWSSMFKEFALWEWGDEQLDQFLAHALHSTGRCLDRAVRALSRDRMAVIDFRSLTEAPIDTLRKIIQRFQLAPEQYVDQILKSSARATSEFPVSTYHDQALPRCAIDVAARLREIQRQALLSHG